ncbi:EF-hand domain-containing protein [Dongia sp.]|uniref:EF-hand domain-containing protein n=1 Tax=Dongia sp. TaxID=1977262 RepID=UPI0035B2B4B6
MNRSLQFACATLLAGLTSALLAASATAQDKPDFRALYFNRLDQNKDGLVSLEDLQRIAAKEFRRVDDNKSSTLSLDEYIFGIPSERQDAIDFFTARFERSDFNNDGQVDFNEDQAYCLDLVARADVNKDGMVSKEEFLAAGGN